MQKLMVIYIYIYIYLVNKQSICRRRQQKADSLLHGYVLVVDYFVPIYVNFLYICSQKQNRTYHRY